MSIKLYSLSGNSSALLNGEGINCAKPSFVGKSFVKITGCPGSFFVTQGYVID